MLGGGRHALVVPARRRATRGPVVNRARVGEEVQPWRDAGFLGLLAIIFLVSVCLLQGFLNMPLYLASVHGMRENTIGNLIAIQPAIIVAFEMAQVQHLASRSPMRILGLGALLTGGSLALLPFSATMPWLVLIVVIWSVGEMTSMPFANLLVVERAGPDRVGTYTGWYSGAFALAFLVGPALGLQVATHFGWNALWYGVGSISVALLVACWMVGDRFSRAPRSLVRGPAH